MAELFPDAKIICCVRNIAWVMDSIERLIRQNAFDVSGLFCNATERATVYSRTEALTQGGRLVGFAYTALKEAFYSEHSHRLLLIDYELFTQRPDKTIALIYQFIREENFGHYYENVEYEAAEFDVKLKTRGLHSIRKKVEFQPRQTILPPDLFERFNNLSFWAEPSYSKANLMVAKLKANAPQTP
ncbi:sulfotransferase [Microcoleus sp. FACHB-672]|uniref:sulfotransferase n=1 Tax=Microcoleus sp. FACHB-672 TaxID=2692825 RepID=UPI00281551AC|nr:sulfotransferase [Microcoleus sp. FACHB-672]